MRRRVVEPTADAELRALRDADAEYHRLCVDIHEPDVPADRLPLDELAAAAAALATAVERLRTRPSGDGQRWG